MHNNSLDIDLACSVGEYFQLTGKEMTGIIRKVTEAVRQWKKIARAIGISAKEQEMMSSAFRL